MAGNNQGGPWGGGGRNSGNGGGDDRRPPGGPGRGSSQIPEIDDIVRKGQEQLRVLMGGRGGSGGGRGAGGGGGPSIGRGGYALIALAAFGLWFFASFYTVKPEEKGVELLFGSYMRTTDAGPHIAPWPFVTAEIVGVTGERTEDIGVGRGSRSDEGLMLTGDENIVDIDFQVVWNITDPALYLFNLAEPA